MPLAVSHRLQERRRLGGHRPHRRAELAGDVGGDAAGVRVVVLGERTQRREHLGRAAPAQGGQVRRPLLRRVPFGDREPHQLLHRALRQPRVEPELGQGGIGAPPQPGLRRHRTPAGRLDLGQLERPAAAVEQQPVAVDADAAARGCERRAGGAGREHPEEAPVGQPEARPDVRAQRAHPALELGRRAGRVEGAVGGLDLVRVGDPLGVLLDPRRPLVERLHQQLPAALLQPRGERAVVVLGPDRLAPTQAHRPGVEPGGEPHDRDAGLGVAGHDRPLHGRRAAPARQQRRVDVDDLVAVQQRLLDEHAVGADDERVGLPPRRSGRRRRRHGAPRAGSGRGRAPGPCRPPAGRAACARARAGDPGG